MESSNKWGPCETCEAFRNQWNREVQEKLGIYGLCTRHAPRDDNLGPTVPVDYGCCEHIPRSA